MLAVTIHSPQTCFQILPLPSSLSLSTSQVEAAFLPLPSGLLIHHIHIWLNKLHSSCCSTYCFISSLAVILDIFFKFRPAPGHRLQNQKDFSLHVTSCVQLSLAWRTKDICSSSLTPSKVQQVFQFNKTATLGNMLRPVETGTNQAVLYWVDTKWASGKTVRFTSS